MVSPAPVSPVRILGSAGLFTLLSGCFPDPLPVDTESDTGASSTTANTTEPTGGAEDGLFACASPPCTVLLVSQTLDDRIDVFDVGGAPYLRGRIGTDLKPDPTGAQTMGNLLDEPYGLVLDDTHLWAAIGHYPDTASGSLIGYPRSAFAGVPSGGLFSEDMYFNTGQFTDVVSLPLTRQEAIFLVRHPSGRLIVGVFANDLRVADWSTPSEILVIDPVNPEPSAIGSFSLDLDQSPCQGGWKIVALDDDVSHLGVACDGSESVAMVTLPDDFGSLSPADAAAAMSACGVKLAGSGAVTTQFVAPDGVGGLLAVQSEITEAPRLWNVKAGCQPTIPGTELPPELATVRFVREPVLLRPPGGGQPAMWLLASDTPVPGVMIVRGGSSPLICGQVSGLDALDIANNGPFALALDGSRTHLAIGAGPVSNPPFSAGQGQVLWASLDLDGLDECQVAATDVVDLNADLFVAQDPRTWVRAPNILVVAELGGS